MEGLGIIVCWFAILTAFGAFLGGTGVVAFITFTIGYVLYEIGRN